ncbi:MAG: hypothetical protein M1829_004581 [Trizodia sp. TS-e1964]|nr:MAG: hypothetical protein M1829_004581 [Trizodia sp. TS-e1964]
MLLFRAWITVAIISFAQVSLCAAKDPTSSITIYQWPLSEASIAPTSLAEIQYNPRTLEAQVVKYSPSTKESADLVRIGLYDKTTKSWTGILTSAESLEPNYIPSIILYLDDSDRVWAIDFRSSPGGKTDPLDFSVTLATANPGPKPHLNRPVVLTAEGKLPEVVPEKTLFQKYVLASLLVKYVKC